MINNKTKTSYLIISTIVSIIAIIALIGLPLISSIWESPYNGHDVENIAKAIHRKEAMEFSNRKTTNAIVNTEDADIVTIENKTPFIIYAIIFLVFITNLFACVYYESEISYMSHRPMILAIICIILFLVTITHYTLIQPTVTINDAEIQADIRQLLATELAEKLSITFHANVTYENGVYVLQNPNHLIRDYHLELKSGYRWTRTTSRYRFLKLLSKTYGLKFKIFEFEKP